MAGQDDRRRPSRVGSAVLTHVNLYGKFDLDMDTRIDLRAAPATRPGALVESLL